MTFREKLQQEHPEKIHSGSWGGCVGCPCSYEYETSDVSLCVTLDTSANGTICDHCWNREIPETEPTNKNEREEKEMDPRNFSLMATMAGEPIRPVEQGTSVRGTMHELYAVLASISQATDGLAEILYSVPGNCEKTPEPSCLETEIRLALELALSIRARLEEIRERL